MKIKWEVADKSTGRYSSFYPRGWPSAYDKESQKPVFMIRSDTRYTNGKDEGIELQLYVAIKNMTGSFDWRKFKFPFSNLKDLKQFAQNWAAAETDLLYANSTIDCVHE